MTKPQLGKAEALFFQEDLLTLREFDENKPKLLNSLAM
jgi:hypothetical protein